MRCRETFGVHACIHSPCADDAHNFQFIPLTAYSASSSLASHILKCAA